MNGLSNLLLVAQADTTYYRFARFHALSEGWQWLVLLFVCLAIVAYVVLMYRKDSIELRRGVAVLLVVLRLTALLGILFYFLDLEKGSERRIVKNSRLLMLVDTSQSMGIRDYDETAKALGKSRAEKVSAALAEPGLAGRLRQRHDVAVYRFADSSKPEEVASFAKPLPPPTGGEDAVAASGRLLDEARITAWVALGLLAAALLSWLVYAAGSLWRGYRAAAGESGSWSLLTGGVLGIAGVIVLAVAHLRAPEVGLAAIVGLASPPAATAPSSPDVNAVAAADVRVDWREELTPRGKETRLGDALRYIVNQERGNPVAGVVVITDGQGNAGMHYSVATQAAQQAGIPVSTIAVGGEKPPINIRVVDLEAPPRVYPGDKFNLKGFLQPFGLEGRTVRVELHSAPAEQPEGEGETFEQEQSLELGADGTPLAVEFESTPAEVGKRRYTLRVIAPAEDHDANDNARSANVEVVTDKNKVLLFAGGPTREYNFLRNLLYRDRDTTSDVLLQTGEPGISQEADEILFEFPRTADELFEYDCIVAFDPDWMALDEQQVRLLERWVSEQAGGLILVAGAVHTPEWARLRRGTENRIDTIKGLYPVVFASEGTTSIDLGRLGGESAWPLQFTRDGLGEKFLWLEDDGLRSEQAWASFGGVYGFAGVREVKSGARVLARFSDPQESSLNDEQPVYFASHFYGAGRVFFAASGEMWRLRGMDDRYFETFYTKLIRWASQGRLLRDSNRGVLLVDKERCFLGDRVTVSAVLTDAQRRPLEVAEVTASLIQPDKSRVPLTLVRLKESAREGEYQAQFTAMLEGDYRLELVPPAGRADELLTQEVRCSSSLAETRQPLRNDAVLKEIAQKTGGQFYVGVEDAFGLQASAEPTLYDALTPKDQTVILPGTPDRMFKQLLSGWLLGLIAGVLCLEWLLRRLSKLA